MFLDRQEIFRLKSNRNNIKQIPAIDFQSLTFLGGADRDRARSLLGALITSIETKGINKLTSYYLIKYIKLNLIYMKLYVAQR
jgi:hypothetical protein